MKPYVRWDRVTKVWRLFGCNTEDIGFRSWEKAYTYALTYKVPRKHSHVSSAYSQPVPGCWACYPPTVSQVAISVGWPEHYAWPRIEAS